MSVDALPTLLSVMTPFPYTAPADVSMSEASTRFEEHAIRHLPLVRGERIVGLLRRDVLEVALEHAGAGHPALAVSRQNPLVVDQGARLEDVLARLAEDAGDAALVVRHGKLVGIVTSTDICQGFAELLGLRDDDDPDVA
ncbi:MAG: CBS domain-containing protein [Deltaproteobacteria bacterium]|nr:CBS domain-containing protein [Deltaproteobacteria bacterium]